MTGIHYSDLWRQIAATDPSRPAIVTHASTMDYGRFGTEAGALADHLRARGVGPGDAAALLLYNRAEYLTFFWACLALGAAPVAINYRYRAGEVRALLDDCAAKALIAPTSFGAVAQEAVSAARAPIALISVADGGPAIADAEEYGAIVAGARELPPLAPRGAHLRLYTGGTTGAPKAVVWEMDTLLHARRQSTWGVLGIEPPADLEAAVRIAVDPGAPRVVALPLPPMLHGTAQSTTMGALALGGTVVLHDDPHVDVGAALRLVHEHRVTRLVVAGDAIALPLVEAIEADGRGLPHVESIFSSGMRFSDAVKRRLHQQGDLMIVDLLASSEGGPFAFGITRSTDDLPARFVMTPDAVLLDEHRREVAAVPGALGILAFRGILPRGYHGDPEKTAQAFPVIDGRRHVVPGDWARVRDDGSIELLGRLGAVVNTGGEKVFPAEVEEQLLSHPAIEDAVVFGLPHERFGEVVSAVVVPAEGAEVDVDELIAYLDARLAGYKKPRHVFVRDTLARSQTGKVDLTRLVRESAAELAAPA